MAITPECCKQHWTSPGDSSPQNSNCMVTYYLSQKASKSDKPDMRDTAGEVVASSLVMYPCGPPHGDKQRQDVQLEHTYSSSVQILDVAQKTCQKQWTIGRVGKRGSEISVLIAWHDDEDLKAVKMNMQCSKI